MRSSVSAPDGMYRNSPNRPFFNSLCLLSWRQALYWPHVNTTLPKPPSLKLSACPCQRRCKASESEERTVKLINMILRVPPWVVWDLHSPSLKSEQISENKEVKRWVDNYLGVGEWVMDQSVAVMGSSSWFERRR
ncbi:hypothetical protein N7523_001849 [Penicillium sp. IBT 18751x]|nr:hypothetical protein N7523_001849 [Penicillium sp. IBT 18751x]